MGFTIAPGTPAPPFALPGVDGRTWSLEDFADAPVLVIVFTCNHCPYVVGSEARMIAFHRDYAPRGVAMVGINANDAVRFPEDGFDEMAKRAERLGFTWPYLRDETQDVAKSYGAIKTPHYFVLDADRIVRYTGRMDDNPRHPGQESTHELRDAVDDLLAGRPVATPVTEPVGCTVKWDGRDPHWIPADICDFTPSAE